MGAATLLVSECFLLRPETTSACRFAACFRRAPVHDVDNRMCRCADFRAQACDEHVEPCGLSALSTLHGISVQDKGARLRGVRPRSIFRTSGAFLHSNAHIQRQPQPSRRPAKFVDVEGAHPFPSPGPAWSMAVPTGRMEDAEGPMIMDQLSIKLFEEGRLLDSVHTLDLLVGRGIHVDTAVFYVVLKRCIAEKNIVLGKRVHALIVKSGYESNNFLANHIICMYASHGRIEEASQVFAKVDVPNRHMWASMILAYVRTGEPNLATQLYRQMRESGVKADRHIFAAVLKACASAGDLVFGREVHHDVQKAAVEVDVVVSNCLVDMYVKCGSIEAAHTVFARLPVRDEVTWTSMIAGYAKLGRLDDARELFDRLNTSNVVTWTAMIAGYAKCGMLQEARQLFDRLSTKNIVTWTAMITAYAQHGLGQEALTLASMRPKGLTPGTIVLLLQVCAGVGALHQGKELHSQIREQGLDSNLILGNSLVDMYGKCGSLQDACRVFEALPIRDVVTWTALLNGYAQHGNGRMALDCFAKMQKEGVEPNDATFTCLLVACSHEGLVNEGQEYFRKMVEDYGIVPNVYHHTCMVDLLARSGRLAEAENMLLSTKSGNGPVAWSSLLSACKSHGDIECGRRCFDHLITLEPESATPYVLMGGIYANAGRWGDVEIIESLRKSAGAKKKPAKACIEVKNRVQEFTVGEERSDTSVKLRSMNLRLKKIGGHVPHTELVLKTVSDSEKEEALCGHAEKLALAFGLLHTPDGTDLFVTKNMRMCNDCHSSTKILSRLEKRQIVVRDAHRVHKFVDGYCSCGDRH